MRFASGIPGKVDFFVVKGLLGDGEKHARQFSPPPVATELSSVSSGSPSQASSLVTGILLGGLTRHAGTRVSAA